ncbi:MAG: nucleotidyltransferase substrate binding protein [Armatimonadetes bacterium]|nr:nucleotidyltransferase substrate binding protein [Armatimonadota bacterium]
MSELDIRWIQRFSNFTRALAQMRKFIEKGELTELEKQGLIQAFEYTFELVWNTVKDYFEAQGETGIYGSRDVFRLAFRRGLIENGETWMDMIKSRTLTSHTYNEEIAEKIAGDAANIYFPEFTALHAKLDSLRKAEIE